MPDSLILTGVLEPANLIKEEKFKEAIEVLKGDADLHYDANKMSMLALAYFLDEQYELSATSYEKALTINPSDIYLKEMLQLAKGNHISEIKIPVPEVYFFEREKLLMKPVVPVGALPQHPLASPPRKSFLKKIKIFFVHFILFYYLNGLMSFYQAKY